MNTEETEYYAGKGGWNRVALEWFYINTGLNIFNNFRYVVGTVIAVYFALKYPLIALVVAIFFTPLLSLFGRIQIKHLSKRMDWLGVVHTTHWSKKGYDMQQETIDRLDKIIALLSDK